MAKYYNIKQPTQYPSEQVSRELREKFGPLHSQINIIVPELEEFALKDKSRASRYKNLAQRIRRVAKDIKDLITEYE
jgi:hypothetical protein